MSGRHQNDKVHHPANGLEARLMPWRQRLRYGEGHRGPPVSIPPVPDGAMAWMEPTASRDGAVASCKKPDWIDGGAMNGGQWLTIIAAAAWKHGLLPHLHSVAVSWRRCVPILRLLRVEVCAAPLPHDLPPFPHFLPQTMPW